MDIYVGNLSYSVVAEDLQELFSQYGEVTAAKVIVDRDTGRSKGFAFVTMTNSEEATSAIDTLNNTELQGRPIRLSETRPREERPPRREGGFGGGSRGPRREGGFGGNREGGYSRGPRREGGFGGGSRGPREGGFGDRSY